MTRPFLLTLLAALTLCASANAAPAPTLTTGKPQSGYMLVVHGGAWTIVGAGAVEAVAGHARRYNQLGWQTDNIDYRPGAASYADVLAAYDALRERAGRRANVCIFGSSAGGHLALMVAARRPSVDCVITEGAPTDLPSTHGYVREAAGSYFPGDQLAAFSPARLRVKAPVLMVHARCDDVVRFGQAVTYQSQNPRTRLIALPGGRHTGYVHCAITDGALNRWHRAERRFLAAVDRAR